MTEVSKIIVRDVRDSDAADISQLFYETVRNINIKDYSPEQVEAWAPRIMPTSHWVERQSLNMTFVATLRGKIIGFAELEKSGHIDCFFCHKDYQRCGAGKALFHVVKAKAESQANRKIFAEVSISAVPFFEKQGFRILREQQINVRGVIMSNFVMEQELNC